MNKEIYVKMKARVSEAHKNNRHTRSLHLAWGLLRGVPYHAMEKWTNHFPSHFSVALELYDVGVRIDGVVEDKRLQLTAISLMIEPLITPKSPPQKVQADAAE